MCPVQMLSRSSASFVETNQALVDVFDDKDARQILICATPFEKLRAPGFYTLANPLQPTWPCVLQQDRCWSAVNKIGRGVGTRTTILIGPARACLGPVTTCTMSGSNADRGHGPILGVVSQSQPDQPDQTSISYPGHWGFQRGGRCAFICLVLLVSGGIGEAGSRPVCLSGVIFSKNTEQHRLAVGADNTFHRHHHVRPRSDLQSDASSQDRGVPVDFMMPSVNAQRPLSAH